jgi:hypothetical protein
MTAFTITYSLSGNGSRHMPAVAAVRAIDWVAGQAGVTLVRRYGR